MQHLQSYSAFGRQEEVDPDADVDFGDDSDEEMASKKGVTDDDPFSSIVPEAAHRGGGGGGDMLGEDQTVKRRGSGKRRSTFQLGSQGGEEDYDLEDEQRFLVDDEEAEESPEEEHSEFGNRDVMMGDDFLEEEEDPIEVFRRELLALQEGLHYEEWGVLTMRQKVSGLLEPQVLGDIDIPPDPLFYARLYSVIQSVFALLLPYSLVMLAGEPATQTLGTLVFALSTIGSVIDILARVITFLPKRSKSDLFFDAIISVASLVAVANADLLGGFFVYVSMLRAIRVFRFVYLFKDYETFQDIFLVQVTVVGSSSVLLIIALFAFIAVFIVSTFLWATESTYFDRTLGYWVRECTPDVPCTTNASPFQSIPAAMWLAFQCVTLTGYGDVFPASALGRVFAGLATLTGVFCIAFPTTILVGNLGIIRRTFFKEREIRENRITAEAIERVTEDLEREKQLQDAAANGGELSAITPQDRHMDITEEHMNSTLPLLFGSSAEADIQDHRTRIAQQVSTMTQKGSFFFMGAAPRRVTLLETGVYMYLPIMQVLCSPLDRLPVVGNVTRIDANTSAVTIFLCLDDPAAQKAAVESVGGHANTVARAAPLVSISVSMEKAHPAMTLFRRDDVGEVHDNYLPLVFLVRSAHRFGNMQRLRRAFLGTRLSVRYTPAISAGSIWAETIFVTPDVLASTKFIAELKSKSVMVAPTVFFNEEEQEDLDDEDLILKKRKNIAFIHPDHIFQLLDGIFQAIEVPPGAIIRNRGEILDGILAFLALILLHSRELYFRDIPPLIHTAVFNLEEVTPFDRLVEVDLEFFRKSFFFGLGCS
ncbi:voltage-gated potassium channel protein, putative [Bodo saltans]|uniref:Voltage-gated potassium channel protein, putative n=1 Tax=Bodo saltans TaxID=75058 RepID=A0A0S4IQ21_BODSA|nr:voltage-gated potassium channel protein, putative [Bodo saltans]|eukprot:CUF08987.1 voltage-gated potassium channel protein, putative [Bodo saltans]